MTERTFGINMPELNEQFAVGSSTIYVVDIEKNRSDGNGGNEVVVTGHDDHGEEVTVAFFVADPDDPDCKFCGRTIHMDNGKWVDLEATGDDIVWRETCDANDEDRAAEHEPI